MKYISFLTAYLLLCCHLQAQSDNYTASIGTYGDRAGYASYASFTASDPASINFLDFSALRSRQKVNLNWVTTNECNTTGFHIQKNTSGTWKDIAYVPARGNKSRSDIAIIYKYSDINKTASSQYRIVEIDKWGGQHLSTVAEVNAEEGKAPMLAYQDHSGRVHLIIQTEGKKDLKIFDHSGKLVKEVNQFSDNTLELRDLRKGVLSLQVYSYETSSVTVAKINIR